jgi:hypothetical protein
VEPLNKESVNDGWLIAEGLNAPLRIDIPGLLSTELTTQRVEPEPQRVNILNLLNPELTPQRVKLEPQRVYILSLLNPEFTLRRAKLGPITQKVSVLGMLNPTES